MVPTWSFTSSHELAFEHRLAPAGISFIDLLSGPRASGRPDVPDPEAWRRVLEGAFERLCAKVETRTPTVLDPYAATNLAEFFAVATEVFFERPQDLRHEYSQLYDQFRTFYRQDPAKRLPPLVGGKRRHAAA